MESDHARVSNSISNAEAEDGATERSRSTTENPNADLSTPDNAKDTEGKQLAKREQGAADGASAESGLVGRETEDDSAHRNGRPALRLDMDLDVEVQLKAKIHGDITLALLDGETKDSKPKTQ